MADTTTVRVHSSTRAALAARGAALGQTVDDVIRAGLAALEWEELRRQGEADARRLAHDEQDRAEVRAVHADLEHLRAR